MIEVLQNVARLSTYLTHGSPVKRQQLLLPFAVDAEQAFRRARSKLGIEVLQAL
jgi:hypothetical protein